MTVRSKKRAIGEKHTGCEQRVMMHSDGDTSSSSAASTDTDHAPPRFLSPLGRFRHRCDLIMHSTAIQILIVIMTIATCLLIALSIALSPPLHLIVASPPIETSVHCAVIALLSLFVVEFALKLAIWRMRIVHLRMECVDACAVLVAIAVTLGYMLRASPLQAIALVVLVRLWRLAKIWQCITARVKAQVEKRLAKERRGRKALEREVHKLREYCMQQEAELHIYRVMLQQNNIAQPTVLRLPTAPRTLNVIAEVNESVDPPEYSEEPPATVC